MALLKSALVAFRVKPKEKEMLRTIAIKEEMHLSEVLRELVRKKIRRASLVN